LAAAGLEAAGTPLVGATGAAVLSSRCALALASSLDFEVEGEESLPVADSWPCDFAPARPAALLLSFDALEAPVVVAVPSTLAVVGLDGAGVETTGVGSLAGGEGEGVGDAPTPGFDGAEGVLASSCE
jgi:hypothetical protein